MGTIHEIFKLFHARRDILGQIGVDIIVVLDSIG